MKQRQLFWIAHWQSTKQHLVVERKNSGGRGNTQRERGNRGSEKIGDLRNARIASRRSWPICSPLT